MNNDQVNGMVKELAGKVQEEMGMLAGSKEQQAQGLIKQISGTAERIYGGAKEAIKSAGNHS